MENSKEKEVGATWVLSHTNLQIWAQDTTWTMVAFLPGLCEFTPRAFSLCLCSSHSVHQRGLFYDLKGAAGVDQVSDWSVFLLIL